MQKLGFEVSRQKGSHVVMKRGADGCVIPNHQEIKIGTLAGVLRQAGISAEEFIAAL
jgi:predicted RNA binding protein YcfA (HicA-like mRNA interferase family)